LPPPAQGSLPAGWLAFAGRGSNSPDRDERFQSVLTSSSFPGLTLSQAWCMPRRRDPSIVEETAISLTSGYVQRASAILPKQGSKKPWRLSQNYALDLAAARAREVACCTLRDSFLEGRHPGAKRCVAEVGRDGEEVRIHASS